MITRSRSRFFRRSNRKRFLYYLGLIVLLVLCTTAIQIAILLKTDTGHAILNIAERRRLFIAKNRQEADQIMEKLNVDAKGVRNIRDVSSNRRVNVVKDVKDAKDLNISNNKDFVDFRNENGVRRGSSVAGDVDINNVNDFRDVSSIKGEQVETHAGGANEYDISELDHVRQFKPIDDHVSKHLHFNRTTYLVDRRELETVFEKNRNVRNVNCQDIFDDKPLALNRAYYLMLKKKRRKVTNYEYLHLTLNCGQFKSQRGYFETPFTAEERDFPLAFSLLGYKNIEAIERFLRMIYRPQNYYCIHMDIKTSREDLQTIKAITDCFPNVFLSTVSLDVKWGEFTVLGADLVCMRDLWRYPDWKYYINLTGQELPLKTNLELVRILTAMKWANVVDGTWIRAKQNYFYRWTKNRDPPPHNIRPLKGSVHVAVNRDFVDFALHDQRSLDFLGWLNNTEIPDESFFSTLNHNPHLGIPGSFLGEPEEYARKPTFTRYKNWEVGHGVWLKRCAGKYVRNICIIGIGDLRLLRDDIGLFVNKISLDFEYLAYECLEEMVYNKTRDQYLQRVVIDTSFYETLDQIRYRLVL